MLDDVAQLALVRPVEVTVYLTELGQNVPRDFLLELLNCDEVVMPTLDLTRPRHPRGVADAQLENAWVASEQLGNDCALRLILQLPFLLPNSR